MKGICLFSILALLCGNHHLLAQVSTTKDKKDGTCPSVSTVQDSVYDFIAPLLPGYSNDSLERNIIYPEKARQAGIEGTVWVIVHLSATGTIDSCRIDESDNALLNDAAIMAIKKISFTPGREFDRPSAMAMSIPVKFRLSRLKKE